MAAQPPRAGVASWARRGAPAAGKGGLRWAVSAPRGAPWPSGTAGPSRLSAAARGRAAPSSTTAAAPAPPVPALQGCSGLHRRAAAARPGVPAGALTVRSALESDRQCLNPGIRLEEPPVAAAALPRGTTAGRVRPTRLVPPRERSLLALCSESRAKRHRVRYL